MWYAFSRLKGNAAAALAPWMDQYGNNPTATQATLNSMYDQLDLIFLDQGRSEKALRELRTLRQGNRPFSELLADLNRLLMEAGGHSWSNEVKKNYLDGALSYEVEGALIGVTKEETFVDYCRQVQQVANRVEALRTRGTNRSNWRGRSTITANHSRPAYAPPAPTPLAPTVPSAADPMDWEPTAATLARQRRRAKWVDEAERSRRRTEGRCLRCGASGHMIKECQYLGAVPPQNQGARPPRASRVVGPMLEDDEVDKPTLDLADEASKPEN